MSAAAGRFLTSVAQSLSTMLLYSREHPAWIRAVDGTLAHLEQLLREEPDAQFSFLGEEVVFGRGPLREMAGWPWAARLAEIGIRRIELREGVTREELEAFLREVLARLAEPEADRRRRDRASGALRYGGVSLADHERTALDALIAQVASTPTEGVPFGLGEEVSAIEWIQAEFESRALVPLAEADAVVRSLTVAMRGSAAMIIPLLRLKASDPYNAIHAINVAVLTMAFAEHLGLDGRTIHELGTAALLHDLGMARVPRELLGKPESLTPREREIVERHTIDGARIIAASDKRMELAAIVALEHHLRPDGSGYPQRTWARPPQRASAFVRVCSVYNALRLPRAHRVTMTAGQALEFIDQRAGIDFDGALAPAFTAMMRRLDSRITVLERDGTIRSPALRVAPLPDIDVDY